ncbi:MAG TPA: hypothetical protein VKR06_11990 [Ktedonosporobacter sp.]|nr:hypothetical protein [Ktedonosporobacter sp.]
MGNYSGQQWNEVKLFARLQEICSSEGVQAAQRLYEFAKRHNARFIWRSGPYGSITPRFLIEDNRVGVFTLEEWKDRTSKFGVSGKFVVNFEYLAKYGQVSIPILSRLAETLRTIPGVKKEYAELEKQHFLIRPPLSLDEILARTSVVEQVEEALEVLL